MTYGNAARQLRNSNSFYTDPIMCAVADGNYNAQHNQSVTPDVYRGVVVDGGYFSNEAIRIAYRNGWNEGSKRAAKRAKRGW